LTLIEPVAFQLLQTGEEADRGLLGEIGEVASAVAEGAFTGDTWGGMAHFVDYWNGEGAWSRTNLETRAALSRCIGKITLDFHAVFTDPTPLEAYRWLRVPTLVLRGEESPGPARRVAALLSATLPDACMNTVTGAGHMLPLTHRDKVNAAIAAHLADNAGIRKRAA
jgi:pimeloyl-ACP methyl ester carboxylesterase